MRVRIHINGRVQGVGFRPAVYRSAARHLLAGFVRNTPSGVFIEAQGDSAAIEGFIEELRSNPPRQAVVDKFEVEAMPSELDSTRFEIIPSARSGDLLAGMPPDIATCGECLAELFEPANRRYRYPFINCVNCGPRFSIIRELPYDRPRTSMETFELCGLCRNEYKNPDDRRFDAQPNACAECGPSIELLLPSGERIRDAALESAIRLLRDGRVVALKGIGGYHFCCDATSHSAVERLRRRKNRPSKPLAVMFRCLEELTDFVELSDIEVEALTSTAAPIVVVRLRRGDSEARNAEMLSRLLSPDTDDLGVFLPYSPLHHLLLAEISPLVMTSGNMAEEPIVKDERELEKFMGLVVDGALIHNRPILRRCDDSVIKIVQDKRLVLRRSRGIVPDPIALPSAGPAVLALGADLKNTICVTRGDQAFLSQHIGDLSELSAYSFFRETISDFTSLLRAQPKIVAYDLHPDYLSSRHAMRLDSEMQKIGIQHHHAHIASCMVENGLTGPVIGAAFDGTGFGPDGSIWGGELLVSDLKGYRRVAHFKQYRMPGSDEAVRNPARMAFSYLLADLPSGEFEQARRLLPSLDDEEWNGFQRVLERGIRSPWTSSAGRLFDAAAALIGIDEPVSYEGQAAIRLQSMARSRESAVYPFELECSGGPIVISFRDMTRAIVSDLRAGVDRGTIAALFHNTIAAATAAACVRIRDQEGLNIAALSGGCFQNELLLQLTCSRLSEAGFAVFSHHIVPPNDGGIALGQAAIASHNA